MTDAWRDRLAGARMQVDQQFTDRVSNSQFTSQQWGLIMTAVEFEIDQPGEPDQAELRARTENIPEIVPELENLPQEVGPGGGASGSSDDGGLFGGLKDALGFSGGESGPDEEKVEAATALVEEYTTELEAYLQDNGQWQTICESAAEA